MPPNAVNGRVTGDDQSNRDSSTHALVQRVHDSAQLLRMKSYSASMQTITESKGALAMNSDAVGYGASCVRHSGRLVCAAAVPVVF